MLKLQFCRQNLLAFNMPKAIFIALIVLASNLRSGKKKKYFLIHIIQYFIYFLKMMLKISPVRRKHSKYTVVIWGQNVENYFFH
jgi:lipopolysaccharide export LptBFGC system permease protein LptF